MGVVGGGGPSSERRPCGYRPAVPVDAGCRCAGLQAAASIWPGRYVPARLLSSERACVHRSWGGQRSVGPCPSPPPAHSTPATHLSLSMGLPSQCGPSFSRTQLPARVHGVKARPLNGGLSWVTIQERRTGAVAPVTLGVTLSVLASCGCRKERGHSSCTTTGT